jgi:hypothetical protein
VDLSPQMFPQVQQIKFVTSEGVFRSSDFHSLDEMSSHNLSGHYSWLNAGRSELRPDLLHYQDRKGRVPLQPRLAYWYPSSDVDLWATYCVDGQWYWNYLLVN